MHDLTFKSKGIKISLHTSITQHSIWVMLNLEWFVAIGTLIIEIKHMVLTIDLHR